MSISSSDWIAAARPRTLLAAISPVIIGIVLAFVADVGHAPSAALALLGAVLIQIGTNFYNDVADFEKGADTHARIGPVRAVQSGRIPVSKMKAAVNWTFGLAVISGIYLMVRGGWPVVVIGATSILFGYLYTATRYSLATLGLADLFVFVFFGPVAVAGTYYVQALSWPAYIWLAGTAPGLLSVAILLVNNIRDIEEDARAGRKTLVVRFGRAFGIKLYAIVTILASSVPVLLFLFMGGPALACLAALIAIPAVLSAVKMAKIPVSESVRLNPFLGRTALLLLVYSLVFSVSWLLADAN